MGPLEALEALYLRQVKWTLDLPHLGLPRAVPGGATAAMLPAPRTIAEINRKTREPHVIGVELTGDDGSVRFVPLRCPLAYWEGRQITHDLVRAGVHPLDIKIFTLTLGADGPEVECVRTSVERLYWTSSDQAELESEIDMARPE